MTSGNLSRHLQSLDGPGLVVVERGYESRRPSNWIKITKKGRQALAQELKQLKALIASIEQADPSAERGTADPG